MTFCTGAQPHHAPTSTAHHGVSLGFVLAFTRLEPDVAAGFAGHSDLVQEQVTLAHDAHSRRWRTVRPVPVVIGKRPHPSTRAGANAVHHGCAPRNHPIVSSGSGIPPVALSGQCGSIALERIVAVQLQLEEIQHE